MNITLVLSELYSQMHSFVGGFKQLEHIATCDKVAIDALRPVTGARKWKTILNDNTVQRAVNMLHARQISLAGFLHRTSYAVMAGVKQGLRLRNQEPADESEEE